MTRPNPWPEQNRMCTFATVICGRIQVQSSSPSIVRLAFKVAPELASLAGRPPADSQGAPARFLELPGRPAHQSRLQKPSPASRIIGLALQAGPHRSHGCSPQDVRQAPRRSKEMPRPSPQRHWRCPRGMIPGGSRCRHATRHQQTRCHLHPRPMIIVLSRITLEVGLRFGRRWRWPGRGDRHRSLVISHIPARICGSRRYGSGRSSDWDLPARQGVEESDRQRAGAPARATPPESAVASLRASGVFSCTRPGINSAAPRPLHRCPQVSGKKMMAATSRRGQPLLRPASISPRLSGPSRSRGPLERGGSLAPRNRPGAASGVCEQRKGGWIAGCTDPSRPAGPQAGMGCAVSKELGHPQSVREAVLGRRPKAILNFGLGLGRGACQIRLDGWAATQAAAPALECAIAQMACEAAGHFPLAVDRCCRPEDIGDLKAASQAAGA